jgi:hypothetical protein
MLLVQFAPDRQSLGIRAQRRLLLVEPTIGGRDTV